MVCSICEEGQLEDLGSSTYRCDHCRLYWVRVSDAEGTVLTHLRCPCGNFLRYPQDQLVIRPRSPLRPRQAAALCMRARLPRQIRRWIIALACRRAVVCHRCHGDVYWV